MIIKIQTPVKIFVYVGFFIGLLFGFSLSLLVEKRERQIELQRLAQQFIDRADEISDEVLDVLSEINTSSFTPCSEDDLAFLRKMAVNSRFLKSAARREGPFILCSALLGRVDGWWQLPPSDFVGPMGRGVRTDSELMGIAGARAMTIEEGSAHVVIGTKTLSAIADPRLSYILAVDLNGHRHVLSSSDPSPPLPEGPMETGIAKMIAGQRYEVACSPKLVGCVSVRLKSDSDVTPMLMHLGFTLMGGLAGAASGFALGAARADRWSLANRLLLALRANEISVVYQPIKRIASGEITGFEVLARWHPREGAPVSPDLFIAAAEQAGFIIKVTQYVVRRALKEMAPILRHRPELRIAINVSAEDILLQSFDEFVDEICNFHHIPRNCLSFEITERSTAKRNELKECISRLRASGHRIYIDDFGVEYSILSYLLDLHVDAVKLDRSFTSSIGKGGKGEVIAAQIARMVAGLNVDLVVEGIESKEQADYFANLPGEVQGQGWLLGKPMGIRDVENYVKLPKQNKI